MSDEDIGKRSEKVNANGTGEISTITGWWRSSMRWRDSDRSLPRGFSEYPAVIGGIFCFNFNHSKS